jgi:OPA family glycerol-3-phosphate transporter-like MFS transporter 1/2
VGSLIAASLLKYGWGWSFLVPGCFIILCGEWVLCGA